MLYRCPRCGRIGMEWDARAKVLMCYFNTCRHVIRLGRRSDIPSKKVIKKAIDVETREYQPA
jgi:hypothetical protein